MARYAFLMPAYKALYLKEAIDSILSQVYKDFELIIVNDASPENIETIVQTYSDQRIRYYENETNIGHKSLTSQWHRCVEHTDAEYIIMASDDDIYLPLYLKELDALTRKYPTADVLHCRICRIDNRGNITAASSPCGEWESAIESLYYRNIAHRFQTMQEYMLRREALIATGGFTDFPMAYYSDDATIVRVGLKNGIVCSDKYLFLSRSSGINISSSPNTLPQRLQACEAFLHWCEQFVKELKPTSEIEHVLLKQITELIWFRQQDMARNIIREMDISQLRALLHSEHSWKESLLSKKEVRLQLLKRAKRLIAIRGSKERITAVH